ncbi:MAG TPA: DUF1345 domain-containing protein [Gaiellaceae bacterium]|nr:DUF1345 domain-containing protein [Gaiellaceae bacterium]
MTAASATGRRSGARRGLADRRALVAAVVGAVTLLGAAAAGASWPVGLLVAWGATAIVFLGWVWLTISHSDGSETERLAASEDASPTAAEALLLSAGVASLVAVGFVLAEAGRAAPLGRGLLTALAVGSVVLSWATVHTIFTLRYARLYYAPPVGGIGFQDDVLPDYADFVYLAFTIGMTFQVSDTDLAKRPIRRAALHHALLSYLFGSVVLAVTVNLVAALLGK